ncbi:MAG: HAMP domain-containing protein [Deltaproteobacteria bacterium]|nr:HAMP domain-containing protein [Deltaproteobacteria bacterium]
MKFTIYRKLLLSYLAMALLTALVGAYAIYSFQRLDALAYQIINEDFVVVDRSKELMDALIARESAEKRYLILRDPSLEELFRSRSEEFAAGLVALSKHRSPWLVSSLNRIAMLNGQYNEVFSRESALVLANQLDAAQALSEDAGRKAIDQMALHIRGIQKRAEQDIDAQMNLIQAQGVKASRITILLSLVSLAAALFIVMIVTYNISRPLRRLEKATARIAEGNFDYTFRRSRADEIGSLARAFESMAQRLKILEERSLDASPLTGLPGNRAIEREIEKRLGKNKHFSLCHVDLDNFKPFVDKYGYAWGSEVIKEVACHLAAQVKVEAAPEDFLGHIGGDDFVIIAAPPRAEELCRRTVAGFDALIRKFYTPEDRERGFFIGKDRQGARRTFPLITITIAIVTDDGSRFQNPLDMAEAAAQLKEYAKTLPGSNYATEKDMKKT